MRQIDLIFNCLLTRTRTYFFVSHDNHVLLVNPSHKTYLPHIPWTDSSSLVSGSGSDSDCVYVYTVMTPY